MNAAPNEPQLTCQKWLRNKVKCDDSCSRPVNWLLAASRLGSNPDNWFVIAQGWLPWSNHTRNSQCHQVDPLHVSRDPHDLPNLHGVSWSLLRCWNHHLPRSMLTNAMSLSAAALTFSDDDYVSPPEWVHLNRFKSQIKKAFPKLLIKMTTSCTSDKVATNPLLCENKSKFVNFVGEHSYKTSSI